MSSRWSCTQIHCLERYIKSLRNEERSLSWYYPPTSFHHSREPPKDITSGGTMNPSPISDSNTCHRLCHPRLSLDWVWRFQKFLWQWFCWEAYTSLSVGWYQLVSWHTRKFVPAHVWNVCLARGIVSLRVVIHQPRSERQLCAKH